jgi:hypothetical protein
VIGLGIERHRDVRERSLLTTNVGIRGLLAEESPEVVLSRRFSAEEELEQLLGSA